MYTLGPPRKGGKADSYGPTGYQWLGGKGSGKPWGKDPSKGKDVKGPGKQAKDGKGKGFAKKVKQEK